MARPRTRIIDIPGWREELITCGDIVQGEDPLYEADPDRAQRRCRRYVELLEMIKGDEGAAVVEAVVASLSAKDDYGVYELTYNVLFAFPPEVLADGLMAALPGLILRHADCAGTVVVSLARAGAPDGETYLGAFNAALAEADPETREALMSFVLAEEKGGWLGDDAGLIRPRSQETR
jgi:hypothetical protein